MLVFVVTKQSNITGMLDLQIYIDAVLTDVSALCSVIQFLHTCTGM